MRQPANCADKLDLTTFRALGVLGGLNTGFPRTVSGLPFKPSYIEFMFSPADSASAGNAYVHRGIATPTMQMSSSASIGTGSGNVYRNRADTVCVFIRNSTGGILAEYYVSSFNNDGVTVNVTNTSSASNPRSFMIEFRPY